MANLTGLFVYPESRWSNATAIMDDGTFRTAYGDEALEPIDLEAVCFTLNAVRAAVTKSGVTGRMDNVFLANPRIAASLPAETGKGRATLRELIIRRCGDKAEAIIAAVEAQASLEQVA